MRRRWWLWCCLLAAGCGRYADFTLPPPSGEPADISFRWEARPVAVLTPGAEGEWDAVDALNPSVVVHQGTYYNIYSGFDGKIWHTGVATSADGEHWTKQGKILSPELDWEEGYIAANGTALVTGGRFLYWYQAGDPPRLGLARSTDGRRWTKHGPPVMEPGPRGSWDERGVADPYVIYREGAFYLYYLGQDRARRQRLGVARSPDGVRWTRLRSNPILELGTDGAFDENGLGEPGIWESHGSYWMLYTGRDRFEVRRLGLARSRDGVRWERVENFGPIAGDQPWNAKVVCDPSLEVGAAGIRVWFGGGDVAHPAENIHGRIGLAVLRPVNATLSK